MVIQMLSSVLVKLNRFISSLCFQQFGFMFIALIWKFDFAPFMVLIIAILNDGKDEIFK